MTVNIHSFPAAVCASVSCDSAPTRTLVIRPEDPSMVTTSVRFCEAHGEGVYRNSEEARELLLEAQEVLHVSPEDSPEEVELRNRIRSYLDLD
ncbi:MAG: hypothetical protein KA758_03545 [Acidimicrobiales bacterium]|jgi:hypothetical protein|nr:hypothetical protein [Acidimicrobiales bacterium]